MRQRKYFFILSSIVFLLCVGKSLYSQGEIMVFEHDALLLNRAPYLEDAADQNRYSPANLFDNNLATAWAVGNGGIGSRLIVNIEAGSSAVRFVDGYAKSKDLFARNNRLKTAKIRLWVGFSFAHRVSEVGALYNIFPLENERTIDLQDTMNPQDVALPFDWEKVAKTRDTAFESMQKQIAGMSEREKQEFSRGWLEYYFISLDIAAVYPGSKYNDTCLTEMRFLPIMARLAAEQDLPGSWRTVRGGDAEEIAFELENGDRRYYSYLHDRPFGTGTWELAAGILKVFIEGTPEPIIYGKVTLAGDRLTMICTDGRVELYQRRK